MSKKELGDFQTPLPLVQEILTTLEPIGSCWSRILEPTCGQGNFIQALLNSPTPPAEIIGLEIQESYVTQAEAQLKNMVSPQVKLNIQQANIFDLDIGRDLEWQTDGPLLVLGNPPWVTNATLGRLNSHNVPEKSNFKKLRGLDALTGASNFDITEFIWLKLIRELYHQETTIALLCKTTTARHVLAYAHQSRLHITDAQMHFIDARRWFQAAVDACLFRLTVNAGTPCYEVRLYESLSAPAVQKVIGFVGNTFVADKAQYLSVEAIDGESPLEWRQGVKHDAAAVMELTGTDEGMWLNGLGETVVVEPEYVFPLVKSSDLYTTRPVPRRGVIIPQQRIGQNTTQLQHSAPQLWAYLCQHKERFEARKSSIYRGKPPFSIFGVGDYSFAPYKVVVSGLHKKSRFVVMPPKDNQPVICDDTCYLLPFESVVQAAVVAAMLNHPDTRRFIESIVFWDAKRPITKALLKRIDLKVLADRLPPDAIYQEAEATLHTLSMDDTLDNTWSLTQILEPLLPMTLF